MRTLNFAKRNFKELIRDPLGLVFTIILPMFLLFIFQQFNIPSDEFKLENFTPGIIVFGFSFITLFTATLVARDRTTSLLIRLGISPMKSIDYILGYILAIVPIIITQNILFFVLAIIMGLKFSIYIIYAALITGIIAILFIAMGVLFGSLFTEKAASGISSVVVQFVCFTSGMYFPIELVGDTYKKICEFLPFESCVVIIKGILNNNLEIISLRNIIVFMVYTIVLFIIAIIIFKKKMISDNK